MRDIAFKPNLEDIVTTAIHFMGYIREVDDYRKNRHRPKNKMYYMVKLSEEAGELGEAILATQGSRRKIDKLKKLGTTPQDRMIEELGDVVNVAFLIAEQFDIPFSKILNAGANKLKLKRTGKNK